ncbi:Gfo/Idh/MocA family oxidoreductase [Streptomyces atroolivaceus]|uniref:Gfo/Idh/MocA family oxidoreductase n=1 Tax=Streptomyces atroolivaceus TaxID=66869 RepID=UPI0020251604|nr:Gfo/Idh/MocA family oxidoreductase [Streptomyces atroolivaceus]
MTAAAPFRVLVCGTNFGRFYAEAVQRRPGYVLAGILSRGSAASRAYAKGAGVPFFTDVDHLPVDIDAACVAVSSSISGGEGTDLARSLMDRGIHVLQEHPVHLAELTACLQHARRRGVQYRVNTHYPYITPVRSFIEAARRLTTLQKPLFVDAATPVHLMHPMVDILGQALGTLRPWRFADPAALPSDIGPQPFRTLQGMVGGVPVTLRVHHQLDPSDRDNHALHWHRLSIGTEGGVLALADTHGPVLWSPRLHISRDDDRRFLLDGPGTGSLGLGTTAVVGSTGTFRNVFTDLWPQAIGSALDGLRDAAVRGGDALRAGQYDLAVCRIWSDLAARLGPPEIVRPGSPRPLSAGDLFPDPAPAPEPVPQRNASAGNIVEGTSYSPSAEFFDLVAARHTASASASAVAALFADAELGEGPVVDIGAGTGLVSEAVARARPDVEILACEPAVGMRAVLTSRVFSDPDLRSRVTITADAAPDLELPDRIGAVLLCGVLGHLDVVERRRLWERLRQRLAPGGLVVVELMQFDAPLALPETRLATAHAGQHRYEWSFYGTPDEADASAMRLHTTWRVHREDEPGVVREVHDSYRWHPFGLRDVAAESGMTVRTLPTRPGAPPLAVLTHESGTAPAAGPSPAVSITD